ncbi:MAG: pilus assembly protein [Victivallales bacterium]|nr:pilus assembly protein [Victivallales bacterium]
MPLKRGSILAETVLVMPLFLLLIFGIIQFALIWTAKQMTAYAAFCATRAIMVVPDKGTEKINAARNAAKVALSWMCIADNGESGVSIPGWGRVNGSGSVDYRVIIEEADLLEKGEANPVAAVRVRFKYPLLIPGMAVNKVISSGATSIGLIGEGRGQVNFYEDLNEAAGNPDIIAGWPYIEIEETCVLPMPYSTANFPTGGFEGTSLAGGGS